MIYTSYFARLSHHPRGFLAVAVSKKCPPGWSGEHDSGFAPPDAILIPYKADRMDWETYKINYFNMCLKGRPVECITSIYGPCVLYCWEGPSKHCHRHLIAQWLRHNGVECQELPREKPAQRSFF